MPGFILNLQYSIDITLETSKTTKQAPNTERNQLLQRLPQWLARQLGSHAYSPLAPVTQTNAVDTTDKFSHDSRKRNEAHTWKAVFIFFFLLMFNLL